MQTPISPKVSSGLNWGIIAALAIGLLSAITPDMLGALGPYSTVAGALVGVAVTSLRAYLTRDPLRDAGAIAAAVSLPIATGVAADLPTPPADVAPAGDALPPASEGGKHAA